MRSEDYRRILDFFFSGVEVSEEMRRKYLSWLAAHGDEPEVKALLEEYWNSVSASSSEFDLTAGLDALMASLGDKESNVLGNRVTSAGSVASTGSATGRGTSSLDASAGSVTSTLRQAQCTAGSVASAGSATVETLDGNKPVAVVRQAHQSVETPGKAGSKSPLLRKALHYVSIAAAAAVIFIGGAIASKLTQAPEKETVLVASSDNAGSYTLPDGTKVWLNRDSRLSFNQDFGKRERNVVIDGEGYFEVTRNESCPFVVNMHDNLRVKVLGTTFNVCSNLSEHSAEVILRSGSVQVSDSESNELVILRPDQKYSWDRGTTEVTSVNAADCCRWYERRLAFDNVRLGDILESLSHKYQIRIKSNAGALDDTRMSLTVRNESVEEILEILSTLLPVRWERQGKTITIYNKTKQI